MQTEKPGKKHKLDGRQYDYGARFYDPVIARFTTIDRFAEKYRSHTPYHYGLDNPIRNIDLNGDSIIVSTNYDYSQTATPTRLSDLGGTTATGIDITSASSTNVNITVGVNISLSAAFKGTTPATNIETQNPGLEREVKAHEEGHRDQFRDAANASVSVTITVNGQPKTFTGTADKVIVDASAAFNGSTEASGMNATQKQGFVNNSIAMPSLQQMNTNITNAENNPNKESDANSRAATKLGPSTIKYNNGSTPVTYNGQTLQ